MSQYGNYPHTIVHYDGRGCGKTTQMVFMSAMVGIPIVTCSRQSSTRLKALASRLSVQIPEPVFPNSVTHPIEEIVKNEDFGFFTDSLNVIRKWFWPKYSIERPWLNVEPRVQKILSPAGGQI